MSNMYQLLSQSRFSTKTEPRKSTSRVSDGGNGFPRMISLLDAKKGSYRTERTEEESSATDTTVSMLEVPFVLKDGPASTPLAESVDEEVRGQDLYFKERIARATRRPTIVVSNVRSIRIDPFETAIREDVVDTQTIEQKRNEIMRLRARVKDRLKQLAVGLGDDDSTIPFYDNEDTSGEEKYFHPRVESNLPSRLQKRRQDFRLE